VKDNAGEFFLGHRIDRLGYDKSPAVDVEHFRSQYRLVEPYINVLSRQAVSTKKVEELEAKIAERDGIVEALLKNGSAKDTEIKDLRERVVRLGEEIKRINDSIEAHSFFRADKVLEARRARKNE
jgi:uncharacterized coiled-coil protein SlyX